MADNVAGGLPGPTFELMFAPLLIGVVLNSLLLGVFIVQVHSYFRLYKKDHVAIRYLIYYLIMMETLNTGLDFGVVYEPLIKLHGKLLPDGSDPAMLNAPTLLAADPIVTVLISTPTQLFMAWRIRSVTKSNWLSGLVGVLAFTSLASGVAATIGVTHIREFRKFQLIEAPLTLWLTSTAFADLFITAFLVNFLWVNKTGFKTRTDSVTNKIIFFTVQTGMLTSFAAIADVTIFLCVSDTTLMFIWDFSLSKLYSICLVSTLIARTEWNNLLTQTPSADEKKDRNAIIKVRRATDIQGLQLYIPSQFESSSNPSPRKRTPRSRFVSEWIPLPLPLAPATTKFGNERRPSAESIESARRTAEWAKMTGR